MKRVCRRQDLKCPFCFSTTMTIISLSLNFTETHRWTWYRSCLLLFVSILFYSTIQGASVNAQNPLHTFPPYFPVDGEFTNLLTHTQNFIHHKIW